MSLSRKDKGPVGGLSPYVPDTSAILTGKIDLLSMNCVLPSAVLGEIRKGKMGRIMENSAFNVRIMSPWLKMWRHSFHDLRGVSVLYP